MKQPAAGNDRGATAAPQPAVCRHCSRGIGYRRRQLQRFGFRPAGLRSDEMVRLDVHGGKKQRSLNSLRFLNRNRR